jgi:hypothetical protein
LLTGRNTLIMIRFLESLVNQLFGRAHLVFEVCANTSLRVGGRSFTPGLDWFCALVSFGRRGRLGVQQFVARAESILFARFGASVHTGNFRSAPLNVDAADFPDATAMNFNPAGVFHLEWYTLFRISHVKHVPSASGMLQNISV